MENGHKEYAEYLMEVREATWPIVGSLVVTEITEWLDGEPFDLKLPAEMYDDCQTIDMTIVRWSRLWGSGNGDPYEGLDELEEEVNLCFDIDWEIE